MDSVKKLIGRSGAGMLIAAAMAAAAGAGLGVGAQRTIEAQPGHTKARHDRSTGPKRQPRKETQDRLAAAEAKRQRRQVRNLAHAWAGGIAFA
jgi:hypothetical protein